MIKAKVDWFSKEKGIGEAIDKTGRKLVLNVLNLLPSPSPLSLLPGSEFNCKVEKIDGNLIAKEIQACLDKKNDISEVNL